jgi:hypothetical protein
VTTDPPVLVCQHVMAAAIEGHIPEDDIALIALRRRPEAE